MINQHATQTELISSTLSLIGQVVSIYIHWRSSVILNLMIQNWISGNAISVQAVGVQGRVVVRAQVTPEMRQRSWVVAVGVTRNWGRISVQAGTNVAISVHLQMSVNWARQKCFNKKS